MRGRTLVYSALIALGFVQIMGYLIHSPALRGIGMMTASSPLPLVFTDVKGIETFASKFVLRYGTNLSEQVEITPKVYAKFSGPYNRRNVYGAAFAYGPLLPERLRRQVLQYALCKAEILKEMEVVQSPVSHANLTIATKTEGRTDIWNYPIDCE